MILFTILTVRRYLTFKGIKQQELCNCMTVLIGKNDKGQLIKSIMRVRYNDEYVYENRKWLISKRTSNFDWRTSE